MKKSLITSVAALALGLSAFAETNMVTKLKNGQLIKYSVEEIEEVFFEDYVDESDTPLKFTILTDSTAAVAEDLAYVSLTDVVTIPSNVKIDGKIYNVVSIEDYTFSGCKDITGIILPNSITKFGESAFADCEKLTHIEIPEGVTYINVGAFENCTSLTSVKLPSTVSSIGNYAFRGCKSLSSIELPSNVLNIGEGAFFRNEALVTIKIPSSVTTIRDNAFTFCTAMTSIEVASDNQNYASVAGVLYNKDKSILVKCPAKLSGSFAVPSTVTTISSSAFDGCEGLTSVEIPSSVTTIMKYAFRNCTNLDITIDNSESNVTVQLDAFKECKSVTWKK
ncbi:MAG: leucine-rich repeat domain-containing protein [Paludibacteraceae bacterium]|nr:leucine-rich repeat domain-containing protein [Paludibacteraceae bacterium]